MVGYDAANDYVNISTGDPLQQTIFAGMIVYQNPWTYVPDAWTYPATQHNGDPATTPAHIHRNDVPTWHMCWLENGEQYTTFADLLMYVNYRIQVDAFDRLIGQGAPGFDIATYFGNPVAWPGGHANVNPGSSPFPISDFYFAHSFVGRSQLVMIYQHATNHGDGVVDKVNPPLALTAEQRTMKIFFGPVTGDGHGDNGPDDDPSGIGAEYDWTTNVGLFWPALPTNTSVAWNANTTRSGNMDSHNTWSQMYLNNYSDYNDFGTNYLLSTIFGGTMKCRTHSSLKAVI